MLNEEAFHNSTDGLIYGNNSSVFAWLIQLYYLQHPEVYESIEYILLHTRIKNSCNCTACCNPLNCGCWNKGALKTQVQNISLGPNDSIKTHCKLNALKLHELRNIKGVLKCILQYMRKNEEARKNTNHFQAVYRSSLHAKWKPWMLSIICFWVDDVFIFFNVHIIKQK